jgi:hypothetical protein
MNQMVDFSKKKKIVRIAKKLYESCTTIISISFIYIGGSLGLSPCWERCKIWVSDLLDRGE